MEYFVVVAKCKECRAEASMKTENRKERKRRFNGSMELRTVRGRDKEREREREKNRKLYSKKLLLKIYTCVCSMHTFIQVLTRTDRSTVKNVVRKQE